MVSAIKNPARLVTFSGTAIALFVLMSLISIRAEAQDQTNFTHFFINPYVLNSSYAGLDGQPSASIIYRKQWMTIDGAPTITNLSLHAPLNNRLSAGVNINNDSKGFFNNSTLLFSAAYHVPVQDHSFIRFGLSVGGSWNTVDLKKLENINDPALGNALDKNASLAGNAGVSFHHRTFNAGISLPTLFSPAYVSDNSFNIREVKPFQAMVIHATNRFYFNSNKNIFEPYALYHLNMDLPSQFELAGIVHLNHLVWAGASYKQYFGISVLGGIKLKNSLAIGASYSIQQSGRDELNSPSFEVSVNYLFGKHRRNAPVYSFVNAVKQRERTQTATAQHATAAHQKQAEAEQQKREEAARLRMEQEEKRKQAAADARAKREQAVAEAEAKKKQAQEEQENKVRLAQQAEADRRQRLADEEARRIAAQREAEAVVNQQPAEQNVEQPVARTEEAHAIPDQEPVVQGQVQDKLQSGGQQPVAAPEDVPEGHPEHEQEQLQRLEEHADDPHRVVAEPSTDSVRHEVFKRGDHPQELDASEYVVVGVFKSVDNARHFSNGLHNLNFNTQFGHLTPKDLWYVYILKTNNPQSARAEQRRISKLFLLRDAWLLTVQP